MRGFFYVINSVCNQICFGQEIILFLINLVRKIYN